MYNVGLQCLPPYLGHPLGKKLPQTLNISWILLHLCSTGRFKLWWNPITQAISTRHYSTFKRIKDQLRCRTCTADGDPAHIPAPTSYPNSTTSSAPSAANPHRPWDISHRCCHFKGWERSSSCPLPSSFKGINLQSNLTPAILQSGDLWVAVMTASSSSMGDGKSCMDGAKAGRNPSRNGHPDLSWSQHHLSSLEKSNLHHFLHYPKKKNQIAHRLKTTDKKKSLFILALLKWVQRLRSPFLTPFPTPNCNAALHAKRPTEPKGFGVTEIKHWWNCKWESSDGPTEWFDFGEPVFSFWKLSLGSFAGSSNQSA